MPRPAPPPMPTANRTDLNVPGPPPGAPPGLGQPNGQPIQVPTGGAYGEAQDLRQQQQATPLPQMPPPPSGPPQAPGAPPAPVNMGAAMQAAQNMPPPNLGSLSRPTERPGEPVTAGLPGGAPVTPGTQMTAPDNGSISSMLSKMAAATGSAALNQLAGRATSMGQ